MKSVACLVDGLGLLILLDKTKSTHMDALCEVERLRNESRRGTVVVVGIVEPVRVELDLAVVEVEVRGVIEADIGIRIICLCPSVSPKLESIPCWQQGAISLLNFI